LFETCASEGEEADYNLYFRPNQCSKTKSEGGCEKRRCSKTNTYNKICTDDSAATKCTLDECGQKCSDHVDFTCSFFAHDSAEQECYLFETCTDEGDEADYTLYHLGVGSTVATTEAASHEASTASPVDEASTASPVTLRSFEGALLAFGTLLLSFAHVL
jgi:hypothetical protein